MLGFRHLECGLAIAGLLSAIAVAGGASAATIDWTLATTNLENGGIWGDVTISGDLTTDTKNSNTNSSIQITEYAGFMNQSVSGPINGPGYQYTYDTGIPCVLAGCSGDIIGYVDFSIGKPFGDKQQYVYASLNDSGRDFAGYVLATPDVPEPASWALLSLGVFGVGSILRRRRESRVAATA